MVAAFGTGRSLARVPSTTACALWARTLPQLPHKELDFRFHHSLDLSRLWSLSEPTPHLLVCMVGVKEGHWQEQQAPLAIGVGRVPSVSSPVRQGASFTPEVAPSGHTHLRTQQNFV